VGLFFLCLRVFVPLQANPLSPSMKILFLTYQGGVAGSTYSISYLAKGLAQRGHTVWVASPPQSLLYSLLENTEVRRIAMTFDSRLDWNAIRRIKGLVRNEGIEIINAQSSYDRYVSILARWLYRLPIKLYHTRRQRSESMGGFLQNWLYTSGTNKIIAVSQDIKNSLIEKGLPPEHIHVIPNGTPIEKYQNWQPEKTEQLRQQYNLAEQDFVIGCVSRLKKQAQVVAALAQIDQPLTMFFVGIEENALPAHLVAQARNCGHCLHFVGSVSGADVIHYYPLFRANILASTIEGLSQAGLESMAMGIPLIATAAAGNLSLVRDGENGLLFEDNNIDQLAEHIRLIRNSPQVCQKLSMAGKKTALEEFSIEKTIDRYELFFRQELGIK
jgi:L-malate glycosyltransferase